MKYRTVLKLVAQRLLVASLLSFGFTMAQTEPTLKQVYSTAEAGKLDEAQLMIQQVLISHPTSAKAFFIRSELYARQGNMTKAREALASAEKFAPQP
jgi:Tfp pilus assembly protein PilF